MNDRREPALAPLKGLMLSTLMNLELMELATQADQNRFVDDKAKRYKLSSSHTQQF